MKQCPKCSATYANNKQKFCTKDGTPLVDAQSASHDETVRIDSANLDDEVTKFISRELPPQASSAFDPYKTTVSTPKPPSPPQPSQPIAPPPAVHQPAPTASAEPAPPKPEPPAATSGGFDPFKTTIATSEPAPPAPSQPPPAPSQPIASPPPTPLVSAPEPPAPATPASSPTSQPVQPPPAAAPPPPRPMASNTANINAAQATNASIPANTVPPVAVPPTPPTAPPAPVAAAAPQPPRAVKKRSKLPLILGILFVLFVLGVGLAVAGYFFAPKLKTMLARKRPVVVEPPRFEPTPIVVSTPDVGNTKPETPKIEVPPYSPPADAVQFVNSKTKLTGKLADHYVDFSFYYPERWEKDSSAGVAGATNFVQVERRLPPNYTQENFAVGWYESAGSADLDRAAFPRLVESLSSKFAKSIGNYQKVSEGETKIGPYDAYEFRFEGQSQQTDRGQFKIWGVSVFVPPTDGSKNGVTLLMLATSLAPELKSISDVGVKGDLPMMLNSFRFEK